MKSLNHLTTFSLVIFTLFVGSIVSLGQGRAGNPSATPGGTDKTASGQKIAVKTAAKTIPASTAFFSLEEVKPGLKGVARTVFAGSEPQEFTLEILGVLPGFTGPRQSTILAKLSGPGVDRTGGFAGMSGSPVFIDDRLVGAIAYSFPFSKEPICGITPIKQMIDIFEGGSDKPKGNGEPRAISFAKLASAEWQPALPRQSVGATSLIAPVAAGSPLESLLGQQI